MFFIDYSKHDFISFEIKFKEKIAYFIRISNDNISVSISHPAHGSALKQTEVMLWF